MSTKQQTYGTSHMQYESPTMSTSYPSTCAHYDDKHGKSIAQVPGYEHKPTNIRQDSRDMSINPRTYAKLDLRDMRTNL